MKSYAKLLVVGVFGLMSMLPAVKANAGWADREENRAAIADQRAALHHDRRELHQDMRRGDWRAAAHERREMFRRHEDIEARKGDINRDRWNSRYGYREYNPDYGYRYPY